MKKFLLATAAVFALAGSAHAERGEPIGWVKSADIDCGGFAEGTGLENNKDACAAKDNYTDAHKRGALCATFGLPVYDRPNGKIIGLLWNGDLPIIRDHQSKGYSFMHFSSPTTKESPHGLMPYSLKSLRQCG